MWTLCALLLLTAEGSFNFISIGDWGCVPIGGQRDINELVVARQFAATATDIDARFVLNTGDNFYYCGVHNSSDPVFYSTFEKVFTEPSTMVPWYGCLGNHDYGYPGSAEAQIEYRSLNSNRWKIPSRYYYRRLAFPEVNISLLVLDASPCQSPYRSTDPSGWDPCGSRIPSCPGCTFHDNIMKQSCTTQQEWMTATLPTIPEGDWRIVMAHAPAGELDVEDLLTPLQKWGFDMYINGHVHLLTHYSMDNSGTYITTGAGCMVNVQMDTPQRASLRASSCQHRNPKHSCELVWEQTVAGYTSHEFSSDFLSLTTNFFDSNGKLLHSAVTRKRGSGPAPPTPPTPPTPPGPPGPSPPPPSGKCCYYRDASCTAGETCCNDKGDSYDESVCKGANGEKHHCVWTGTKCVVG